MATKRKIEVFSAGCPAYEETVQLVNGIVCPSCEVNVLAMKEPAAAKRAKTLAVRVVAREERRGPAERQKDEPMNGTMQDLQPGAPNRPGRWWFAASVSSILSAFIASICCVGPLVFALLGIGGAGLLVKFEPYRPYFIALTFALLGTGFYLTHRKPKTAVDGGPECGCPAPRANRAGKIVLWIATVLVVVLLSFPYLAPYLLG